MFGFHSGRRFKTETDEEGRPTAEQSRSTRPKTDAVSVVLRFIVPLLSTLFLILLVLVPVGLAIWLLFFTDTFIIKAVTVLDARMTTVEQVTLIVEDHLSRVPLRGTIFFVQPEVLETEILTRMPQVRSAHITRKLPGTVKVVLQEKEPAFLLLSGARYFFVDDAGVVYERARLENLPGIVLSTVKNDDREATVSIGAPVVEESFVDFILGLQDQMPDRLGVHVAEIHIPSLAAREIHVVLDNNWTVLFDATRPLAGQLTVLSTLLNQTITQEEQAALEYIDLRIAQRAYYRTRLGTAE